MVPTAASVSIDSRDDMTAVAARTTGRGPEELHTGHTGAPGATRVPRVPARGADGQEVDSSCEGRRRRADAAEALVLEAALLFDVRAVSRSLVPMCETAFAGDGTNMNA